MSSRINATYSRRRKVLGHAEMDPDSCTASVLLYNVGPVTSLAEPVSSSINGMITDTLLADTAPSPC